MKELDIRRISRAASLGFNSLFASLKKPIQSPTTMVNFESSEPDSHSLIIFRVPYFAETTPGLSVEKTCPGHYPGGDKQKDR